MTEAEELELLELEAEAAAFEQASNPGRPALSEMKVTPDNVSAGEAFLRGVEQVNPWSDEAAGLGAGLYEVLNPEPDSTDSAATRFGKGFHSGKAEELQEISQAWDANPDAFAAGAAGSVLSQAAAIPATVKAQMAYGALQGAGAGEGVGERVTNAVIGGALPAAVPAARAGLNKVSGVLDDINLATIGLPQSVRSKLVERYGQEGLRSLGRFLREQNITNRAGQTLSGMEQQVDDLLAAKGQQISEQVKSAPVAPRPQSQLLADLTEGSRPEVYGRNLYDKGVEAVNDFIAPPPATRVTKFSPSGVDPISGQPNIIRSSEVVQPERMFDAPEVWELAKSLDKQARTWSRNPSDSINNVEIFSEVADNARSMLKEAAPELASSMKDYSQFISAKAGIDSAASKTAAPLTWATAPAKLFQNTVASKPFMTLINSQLEWAGKFAPLLEKALETGGPSSALALHYSLLQKEPEYNFLAMQEEEKRGKQ